MSAAESNPLTAIVSSSIIGGNGYAAYSWTAQVGGGAFSTTTWQTGGSGSAGSCTAPPCTVSQWTAVQDSGVQGSGLVPNVPGGSTPLYLAIPVTFTVAAGITAPVTITISYSNGVYTQSTAAFSLSPCGKCWCDFYLPTAH